MAKERFGKILLSKVDDAIKNVKPKNTERSDKYVWKQFTEFCLARSFEIEKMSTDKDLCNILKDWAYNMRKSDGSDYKEGVVKLLWNKTAKMLQELYFEKYNRHIDPFNDMVFQSARFARNAKRKELQAVPGARKESSTGLTRQEIEKMAFSLDENTPDGLQRKFFHIAASELAWRGNEAVFLLLEYFKEEKYNNGSSTGRLEYNPIFSKTAQGGASRTCESKWLVKNLVNPDLCPIRLYFKLMSKRGENIKTNRFFLTVNQKWKQNDNFPWFKNCPAGINIIRNWTKMGAINIGLDTKNKKITNHSNRASTVSALSSSGANLQEVIKITGHSSINSVTPYLQLSEQHHLKILSQMRAENTSSSTSDAEAQFQTPPTYDNNLSNSSSFNYNNCNFVINNNYCNKNV